MRLVPPAAGENFRAEGLGLLALVAVEDRHQISNVTRGQPQRLDLGQFSVGWHVGNAVPQVGEGVVDALRASSLLLIGSVASLGPHDQADGLTEAPHVLLQHRRRALQTAVQPRRRRRCRGTVVIDPQRIFRLVVAVR